MKKGQAQRERSKKNSEDRTNSNTIQRRERHATHYRTAMISFNPSRRCETDCLYKEFALFHDSFGRRLICVAKFQLLGVDVANMCVHPILIPHCLHLSALPSSQRQKKELRAIHLLAHAARLTTSRAT